MDYEYYDYLEQQNYNSDDCNSIGENNKYSYHTTAPFHKIKSRFKYDHHHQQQREPSMSSSCSPKPIMDYRQRKPSRNMPITPPHLSVSPILPSSPSPSQPLLQKMTKNICQTYENCNSSFQYNANNNPKRVLTKPSSPVKNGGFDNENSDYILYVNGEIGGKYSVIELLGSGTFGQVAKCKNKITGELVAIKVIKNKPAYLKQSSIEVEILKLLNREYDPNDEHHILRLLEYFMHKHHLCLVFELLSVNLYDLIKQNSFKGLTTKLIHSFTVQILDVLVILKKANVIHCDLKPENILLLNIDSPVIKVVDFGSACKVSHKMYSYIQSRFYRSPEVLLGLNYTSDIDMWSLGCIVAELFLGLPIFPGSSEYNQLSRIVDSCGMPPDYMIDQGKNGNRYFNITTNESDRHMIYTLKPRQQFASEQRKHEKPGKQYFKTNDLDDLILNYRMPKHDMIQEEIDIEMENRRLLLDFLKQVLNIDPNERLSPEEALQHPFITQYHDQKGDEGDDDDDDELILEKSIEKLL